MRVLLSFAFLVVAPQTPGADAPGSPKAETPDTPAGWIDLMKPAVWKKYDANWVVTDEVKLDAEKNTKLKAASKEGGPICMNGEKGRLPVPDHEGEF
jgi:hypothetical protein